MSNLLEFAKKELEILQETVPDALVSDFIPEILALIKKFGESGQSGGSAPFTASAIAHTVKKLCLFEPIAPLTGKDDEWNEYKKGLFQNNRCSAVFKEEGTRPHYLDAIVWQGEERRDTFTGTIQGVSSRQYIKEFPFKPKTFYIDVCRRKFDPSTDKISEGVSCSDGDYTYFIKDPNQLKEVFEYYDEFVGFSK